MANEKYLKGRFQQKTDTKENWDKAKNFVPLEGEIIVYSDLNKMKVGDGTKSVGELEFCAGGIDEEVLKQYAKKEDVVGKKDSAGGEIFNDYENNEATGLYSTAFGKETKAIGDASFAGGDKIYRAYEKVPANPPDSDLRYCEAIGTGSMAFGMGAIAYSRASKSFGYRTQTGYPPNQEELDKRPEAVCLGIDPANPSEYSPTKDYSAIDAKYANADTVLFTADSVTLKIYDMAFDEFGNDYKSYVVYRTHTMLESSICKIAGRTKVSADSVYYDASILKGSIQLICLDSENKVLATEIIRKAEDYFHVEYVEDEGSYAVSIADEVSIDKKFTVPANTSYIKIEAVGFGSDDDGGTIYDFILSDLTLTVFATENVGQAAVAIGADAKALGNHSLASGHGSVARGKDAVATGKASKAYGDYSFSGGFFAKAIGEGSIAFGYHTEATGEYSVVLGKQSEATGDRSIAFGNKSKAIGPNSFAGGVSSEATGSTSSFAMGYLAKAKGTYSVAMGYNNEASGDSSFAFGHHNILPVHKENGNEKILTPKGQVVVGKFNAYKNEETLNALFVVGNGEKNSKRSNALVVDVNGNVSAEGEYGSMGADYAEMFEWQDGNPEAEDRVGYVVALDGEKIRLAQVGDDILGVISGTAAMLGDSAAMHWKNKYVTDKFGRIIYDEVEEFEEIEDPETHELTKLSIGFAKHPRINPNYDSGENYIPRERRPEWGKVGLMGKLYVRDDGTCVAGGYAKVGTNGVLTNSETYTSIRVMKRTDENIVWVLMK